jgi:LmbE family N-acetylglucosaminyl deacetylase
MGPLAERALDFARKRPRQNPPEDGEIDERVQEFCIEQKTRGEALGEFDEGEWREALEALGVDDIDLASYMEDVASWGTDG